MTSWSRAAVLLAGLVALAAPAATAPAVPNRCRPVNELAVGRPDTSDLAVPVVVHYMIRTGSQRDVATEVTPAMLRSLFADTGRVTELWRQAGIRPYLHGGEKCPVLFSDFGLPVNSAEEVPSPARTAEARSVYRQINKTFNARDVAALDLYVWWGINTVGGYGDRYLDSGAQRFGGAWIDRDCRTTDTCDLLIAHEIGHVLGLCHACTLGSPIARVQCSRCLPKSMQRPDGSFVLATCDQVPGRRIMREDNLMLLEAHRVDGTELNTCERELAKSFAARRFDTH